MKTSELINKLQELQKEHGDIHVNMNVWIYDSYGESEIEEELDIDELVVHWHKDKEDEKWVSLEGGTV